jgi:hypothetical protein
MQIRIKCTVHDSPMIPAGEEPHWIPVNGGFSGVFELDEGDLYCVGGVGDHRVEVKLTSN